MVFFACAIVASMCIPLGMATLSPQAARRLFRWAWLLLIPIMTISCITLASQGERGLLSNSLWISMGFFLLIFSFGIGFATSKIRYSWHSKKRGVERSDLD